jgi:hypothetical protein
MPPQFTEIRIRGKDLLVPSADLDGRTIVVTGRWLKVAAFRDEELVEGTLVADPIDFARRLREAHLRADVLCFPQAIDEPAPKFKYPHEIDNVAAADTRDFDRWWEGLPQESRKNARRASKRGVTVEPAVLTDEFVKGIKRIYDESPVRQGMKFWHFGKDLERVRLENATYAERSDFIGAYCEGELIGFMKWVYVDKVARIMQILSMSAHYDKRPMNAMIAKAVEICHRKGAHYLIYSKFTFGNKTVSQLSDFKRRNGFNKMEFPRYYMPLTLKGALAVRVGLHRGILGMLPPRAIGLLWAVRAKVNDWKSRCTKRGAAGDGGGSPSKSAASADT